MWIQRFDRLCAVLFIAWTTYCVVVRPMVLGAEGTTHYEQEVRDCSKYSFGQDRDRCLADAKREWESGMMSGFGNEYERPGGWSYGWYFRTHGWWIVGLIVLPSAVVYGSLRGIISTVKWVWGGAATPEPSPSRRP